ncbi:LysM peptidoglycan-binding domain-containing protein [Limosilactobacillus caecicola]|uniref:LysM peptidoglycan-binding domain-containing protein n=1 Tax=Limosilactobacillus caecicola TaxID=2941332 RepID=UPI00203AF1F6
MAPITTNAVTLSQQEVTTVKAAKGDHGVDWSKYQDINGKWGYANDKFSISQVGGYYNGSFVEQYTYPTQVRNTIAMGRRAHTYIYAQFSGRWQADQMLNYYLPKVQTPKGSIVALDVESGSPDTDSVLYALKRVQDAGYTAVLYGYKNFLTSHLDLHQIASQYPLWLAEYPNYAVTPNPNYNFFPSFENVAIFQFTSTYIAGGLDGNIDLTGITDNGYKNGNAQKPQTNTPAMNAGKQLHQDTHNYTVQRGDSWWSIAHKYGMDMYTLASLNNQTINNAIYPGEVLRVADKDDSKKVDNKVNQPIAQPNTGSNTWTDNMGDTWHKENGTFTSTTWLHLRWGAKPSSSAIAYLGPGATIKYDAWSNHNGFIYVRQPRANGYGYIAVRNAYNHVPYGAFK